MGTGIWKERPTLEGLNAMGRGNAVGHCGIVFTAVGDDSLSASMPVDARTLQPLGLLHGGASVLLAETLGSAAAHACVDREAEIAVGIEVNANHLRAVRAGHVHGEARPLHLGRSTQVWEIRIADDAGRPTCVSRLTMAVVPRERP